jgi:hypothetical protein
VEWRGRGRDRLRGHSAGHSLYWPAHGLVPSSPLGGQRVNAEFNWWLLIVGLVLGAALTWLVMAESARRDADLTESEQRGEALWIASVLSSSGHPTDGARVEEVLRLHREYLAAPPPDDPDQPPAGVATESPIEAKPTAVPERDPEATQPVVNDAPAPPEER